MARTRELEAIGESYKKTHRGYLPDRVQKLSRRAKERKADKALGEGVGWLSRLQMAGDDLGFYTVSLQALGLAHLEHESNLYNHEAVNAIKQATHQAMPGAFWGRLEVGKERRLHVHLFAHQPPLVAHFPKGIYDLKGIKAYLSKAQVPSDLLSAGVFLQAKRQSRLEGYKRLPKTSFARGIPTSKNLPLG
jgi:hypothetical protein